jgi:transcriptional regulator with XRE-family HTH domain
MVGGAYRLAVKTTEGPLRVGKALLLRPEQAKMLEEAGQSIQDLREVVGLTRDELSDILDLKDQSLMEAVENGTAILSFDLILRLAAVLARNDPIPFVMQYTRTYKPELWQILDDWGVGALYLNFERERQFINIYRRHDAARNLSDESFQRILDFTREAFDAAIHFAAEYEQVEDRIVDEEDEEGESAPLSDD